MWRDFGIYQTLYKQTPSLSFDLSSSFACCLNVSILPCQVYPITISRRGKVADRPDI